MDFMIDLTYGNNIKFYFSLDHTHDIPYYDIMSFTQYKKLKLKMWNSKPDGYTINLYY